MAPWWISVVLAAVYGAAGLIKLVVPKARLLSNRSFAWAATVPDAAVKAIGAAEVLGAAGLLLPRLTGAPPAIATAAAAGLVLVQAGAITLHGRRREFATLPINVILLALALAVATGIG